jgi:hypothetical protein
MIEHAWKRQPGREWYVFIEADTYMSISNLLRFLETKDPKQKLYFGNSIRMWEHPTPLNFAHGGSGFILSGASVESFHQAYQRIDEKFTPARISQWFYGDFIVADAMDEELGIHVTDVTPMVNSDHPALLPFDERVWCRPVITLHHMDPRQFDDMYKFQKARNFSELLFRDVFSATYRKGLPAIGQAWDNLSGDQRFALQLRPNDPSRMPDSVDRNELLEPGKSYKACQIACDQNEKCFQFSYLNTRRPDKNGKWGPVSECHLSRVFRLGKTVDLEKHPRDTQFDSGWHTERIEKFIEVHQECADVDFGAT